MKLNIPILSLFLCGLCFAQSKPALTPAAAPPASAPAPDKRPLTPEQSARMKGIDATEAQFELKINELIQMVQKAIQGQRNEVWAAACQAAGWTKNGECQVDPSGAGSIVRHEAAPEVKQEAQPPAGK
jgi:hypothetical protein